MSEVVSWTASTTGCSRTRATVASTWGRSRVWRFTCLFLKKRYAALVLAWEPSQAWVSDI